MTLTFGLPCTEHPESPQDKSNRQTEILVWEMLLLFLILSSPSSHTTLMHWSEALGEGQTQPSITITPTWAIQGVQFRQFLLLDCKLFVGASSAGACESWTYCQQLNNISISSPYKKIQPKICFPGDFALIVTWMLLITFSPAEKKAEPSLQLCASVSPPFECAPSWTPRSAEKSWLWCLGLPRVGLFWVKSS